MKLTAYIFLSLLVLGITTGCKKDIDIFRPDHQDFDTTWVNQIPDGAPVNFLMRDLAPIVYTDSIDVTNSAEAILSSGVSCSFNNSIFVNAQNVAIAGKVLFASVAFSKKGNIIQLGQSTQTDKQLIDYSIISALSFYKDNQLVFLQQGDSIDLHFALPYAESLSLFYRVNDHWEKTSSPGNRVQPTMQGYQLRTNNLPWICVGQAMDTSRDNETFLQVKLPDNYTNTNSIAYLVLKNKNTVVRLLENVDSKCFYHPRIPKNEEGMLVVLSKQVHDYYLGSESFNGLYGTQTLINVKPIKRSFNDVMRFLSAL